MNRAQQLLKNTKLLVLERVFGHKDFTGKQEEAINTILNGENCLIVLPTGGGKSIRYSILISGLLFPVVLLW
jgi:ATP-dependent DNA helicase RecQ